MSDVFKKYPRSGPNVNEWKNGATMANETTLNSPVFISACKRVGIEPTRRQASKFARKMGLAYGGK